MASWILVPCLVSLRNEFNKLAPSRDKASDGSVGDTTHAAGASDHNPDETGHTPSEDADNIDEVHAIDVDTDLRKAGWNMQRCVDIIVGNHRAGRDNRLQNVIYNRRIASASWGWTWKDYTGPSAHTEHAHFSARYTTKQEQDTSPWGLLADEEDDMPSAAEVAAEVVRQLQAPAGQKVLAQAVLTWDPGVDPKTGKTVLGGVVNPTASVAANPTVMPAWALYRGAYAAELGKQNQAMLQLLLQQSGVSAEQITALQTSLGDLPDAIVDEFSDRSRSVGDLVTALQAVLGDRAAEVAAALLAATGPADATIKA